MTKSIQIEDLAFRPYLSSDVIEGKINKIANEIKKNEEGNNPIFLVILTGAFMFATDLLRKLNLDCEIRFVRVKSYQGTESSGIVNIEESFLKNLEGRNIIIIEDIVDTGLTMQHLTKYVNKKGAKSIKICTLLHKPEALQHPIKIDYLGFNIPNLFVVGYGLDYNDKGRNLPEIWQLIE